MKSRVQRLGFTLVETAMAVALSAGTLLMLLALLPKGLDELQAAGDREAQARITQTFIGRMQMTDWNTLTTELASSDPSLTLFFDNKGMLLTSGSSDQVLRAYVARAQLPLDGLSNNIVPADSGAQPYLSRVQISISSRPGISDPFAKSPAVRTTIVTLSKLDR